MVLPLASRFAVLSVDDDEESSSKKSNKSANRKTRDGKPSLNQQSKPSNLKNKSSKKADVQSNQPNKNKNKPSSSQRKKKNAGADQWELWKEKDAKVVDEFYESELHQAILLSKLDYEEKKDVYEQHKKDQEAEKVSAINKKKKGNKSQFTMSLNEFNNLADSINKPIEESKRGDFETNDISQPQPDTEFFDRIQQDAKKVFHNEQIAEKKKAREPFVNDAITIAQLEDQLEKKDKVIVDLKKEITRLKEELHQVKTRNKALCQILGQGEMRDKAEVLVQMEKTKEVKDELSKEVERLHAILEQERSKVRSLTNEKNKGKNKKRTASENQ